MPGADSWNRIQPGASPALLDTARITPYPVDLTSGAGCSGPPRTGMEDPHRHRGTAGGTIEPGGAASPTAPQQAFR